MPLLDVEWKTMHAFPAAYGIRDTLLKSWHVALETSLKAFDTAQDDGSRLLGS